MRDSDANRRSRVKTCCLSFYWESRPSGTGLPSGAQAVQAIVVHSMSELLAGITAISEIEIMSVHRTEMQSTVFRKQHVVISDTIP